MGNIAESCFDFGKRFEIDKCCREHDNCPYTFGATDPSFNGYTTNTLHTVSHCECDKM